VDDRGWVSAISSNDLPAKSKVCSHFKLYILLYLSRVKQIFCIGDKKHYKHIVTKEDFASFHGETVHEVYSTFCLTRDAEWSSRLFVLEMKEESEEGIGTFVRIEHITPAFENETVIFTATLVKVEKNDVVCSIEAKVGNRLIAKGQTGQKIIQKEKLKKYFTLVRQENEAT
jgi:predicted thioesterase